mmetsp:Transcript_68067/g.215325  ORF Transcript_68067/g.215325 Transcript_68067/m.215325 type:complete len:291 (+) Transcript_68067:394-1266(+)
MRRYRRIRLERREKTSGWSESEAAVPLSLPTALLLDCAAETRSETRPESTRPAGSRSPSGPSLAQNTRVPAAASRGVSPTCSITTSRTSSRSPLKPFSCFFSANMSSLRSVMSSSSGATSSASFLVLLSSAGSDPIITLVSSTRAAAAASRAAFPGCFLVSCFSGTMRPPTALRAASCSTRASATRALGSSPSFPFSSRSASVMRRQSCSTGSSSKSASTAYAYISGLASYSCTTPRSASSFCCACVFLLLFLLALGPAAPAFAPCCSMSRATSDATAPRSWCESSTMRG